MTNNQEPLVDSGMVEAALAITVLGFVVDQFEGVAKNTYSSPGAILFVVGGFSTVVLYTVYLWDWIGRHRRELPSTADKTKFFLAFVGLSVLFLVLLLLVCPVIPLVRLLFPQLDFGRSLGG